MYNEPKDIDIVKRTIEALAKNGITAILAESPNDAKSSALDIIPKDASVMTMTSVTLTELGIDKEINDSGQYNSVRAKLKVLDLKNNEARRREIANAPDISIGSVHAVTEDGKIVIASNTGSQLAAHVYGAKKVIFVVGSQKIVKDIDDAIKRIYEYILPLESERANKAYNSNSGSFVSKLLIINREIQKDRIKIIFVPKNIGF